MLIGHIFHEMIEGTLPVTKYHLTQTRNAQVGPHSSYGWPRGERSPCSNSETTPTSRFRNGSNTVILYSYREQRPSKPTASVTLRFGRSGVRAWANGIATFHLDGGPYLPEHQVSTLTGALDLCLFMYLSRTYGGRHAATSCPTELCSTWACFSHKQPQTWKRSQYLSSPTSG